MDSVDTPGWRRGLNINELEVAAAYLGELGEVLAAAPTDPATI